MKIKKILTIFGALLIYLNIVFGKNLFFPTSTSQESASWSDTGVAKFRGKGYYGGTCTKTAGICQSFTHAGSFIDNCDTPPEGSFIHAPYGDIVAWVQNDTGTLCVEGNIVQNANMAAVCTGAGDFQYEFTGIECCFDDNGNMNCDGTISFQQTIIP